MPKTVELNDLADEIQVDILSCAVNYGVPITRIMGWINAGIAAAVAADEQEGAA